MDALFAGISAGIGSLIQAGVQIAAEQGLSEAEFRARVATDLRAKADAEEQAAAAIDKAVDDAQTDIDNAGPSK